MAYYLPEQGQADQLSEETVLSQLSEKLPGYMLPQILMQLDHFPLTANGKLDKKALPDPLFSKAQFSKAKLSEAHAYVPPKNDSETRLVKIWQDILNLPKIGMTDDFFKMGGDSLLAIQATRKMRDVLGQSVKIADLFRLSLIHI